MIEITAGCTLSVKLSFPHNQYENVDCGYYCGFKETVPDDTSDEKCDAKAIELINRSRKIVEGKVDEHIIEVKDVKIFSSLQRNK